MLDPGASTNDRPDDQGTMSTRLSDVKTRSAGIDDHVLQGLVFEADAVAELLRQATARLAHLSNARSAADDAATSHRRRLHVLLEAITSLCPDSGDPEPVRAAGVSGRTADASLPFPLDDHGRAPHLACLLLGAHRTFVAGRELKEWRGRRAQTLFHYLVSCGSQRASWEVLVEALWPGMRETAGRRRLHQAVYSLRQTLHALDPDTTHIVCVAGTYRLNPDLTIWVDTVEFDRLASRTSPADQPTDEREQMTALASADALYRGDLLAGETAPDWVAAERDRLRTLYIATAGRYARSLEAEGDHERVVDVCQRARAHEPWNEELTRCAMRSLAALGQRAQAIAAYRNCVATLTSELGVAPEAATTRLYRVILDDASHHPDRDASPSLVTTL